MTHTVGNKKKINKKGRGSQIFQKSRSHPHLPGARRITQSKFHTGNHKHINTKSLYFSTLTL
jgi:hypothetical protein